MAKVTIVRNPPEGATKAVGVLSRSVLSVFTYRRAGAAVEVVFQPKSVRLELLEGGRLLFRLNPGRGVSAYRKDAIARLFAQAQLGAHPAKVRYIHAGNNKPYEHVFGRGVLMRGVYYGKVHAVLMWHEAGKPLFEWFPDGED